MIVDRLTGQVRPAQIFVAVMGASNFTYAEASWTQALAEWIGARIRVFAALGGVPNLLVSDDTKVAVIKACLYELQVNRTYAEMAAHYDTAILPARPRRRRDKILWEVDSDRCSARVGLFDHPLWRRRCRTLVAAPYCRAISIGSGSTWWPHACATRSAEREPQPNQGYQALDSHH
jgi:hypothetical protein